jgi:hypothetical protein
LGRNRQHLFEDWKGRSHRFLDRSEPFFNHGFGRPGLVRTPIPRDVLIVEDNQLFRLLWNEVGELGLLRV